MERKYMNFNNRVFNVNGNGDEGLLMALKLVFLQNGSTTAKAFTTTKEHGLILCDWDDDRTQKLPTPMTAEEVFPMVKAWLAGDEASSEVVMEGWDADKDHDGSNSAGWRVFCEDWGHVDGIHSSICAIKPAMVWHGK